jgi:hypothetical protein
VESGGAVSQVSTTERKKLKMLLAMSRRICQESEAMEEKIL